MSRIEDYEPEYENAGDLWYHNVRFALSGKRGQKALVELKEALQTLPNRRLIASRLSKDRNVCAVGAYAWYQKVKGGMDPEAAFETLSELDDEEFYGEGNSRAAVDAGVNAGLTKTLAWHLMYLNDEDFAGYTPEQRYERFMEWIDKHLLVPA